MSPTVYALRVAKSDSWCYLGDDGKDNGNDQGQRPSPGAVVAIAVLKKNIMVCHHSDGSVDLESSLALGTDYVDVKLLVFAENFLDLITVAPPESGLCR